MIPVINVDICTGCGKCVEACPPAALFIQDRKVHLENDICEECGFCAAQCKYSAIIIPFPLSGNPFD